MDKQHIETEATIALSRLRSRSAGDELATVTVMRNACDALDKGDSGERAVRALLDLWRELKLEDISAASISELRAVVDRMYLKLANESRGKAED